MLHIPAEDAARKAIRILNPISENLSIMRTLLTPSMLNVIVDNLKKGNAEGRLFEMAPVYLAKELPISEHPHERQTLCIGAFGPEEDFFTVKGAMEALAAGFDLTFTYERETTPWLHPASAPLSTATASVWACSVSSPMRSMASWRSQRTRRTARTSIWVSWTMRL